MSNRNKKTKNTLYCIIAFIFSAISPENECRAILHLSLSTCLWKLSNLSRSHFHCSSSLHFPSTYFSYHLLFSFALSFFLPLSVPRFPYNILLIIINLNINMFIRIFRSNDVTNSNLKGLWLEIGILGRNAWKSYMLKKRIMIIIVIISLYTILYQLPSL